MGGPGLVNLSEELIGHSQKSISIRVSPASGSSPSARIDLLQITESNDRFRILGLPPTFLPGAGQRSALSLTSVGAQGTTLSRLSYSLGKLGEHLNLGVCPRLGQLFS